MQMSPTIGKLAEALAKAQGAMKHAVKDADNPYFKSTYSTLASVMEAIREPFSANGLAFSQPSKLLPDGSVAIETIIMHTSGEWIMGEISAKPVKADPQGIGSLVSYLKRYELQAMVGIASADDDANEATHTQPPPAANKPKPRVESKANVSHPAPVVVHPETASIYDDASPQLQKTLAMLLKKQNVPEQFWETIGKRLNGLPSTELKRVIAEVRAEVSQ